MGFDDSLESALRSSEPVRDLRALVERFFSEGHTKESVLALFETARQRLREANREADEDAVIDVMDHLVGWCAPHMKIPSDQPVVPH